MNKRNKSLIIISIVFLVIACVTLLIGGALSRWDIIGWLGSKQAIWLYTICGLFVIILITIIVKDRIKKL